MPYQEDFDSSRTYTEEDQIRALRLSTLARVYEGADRVLTGDPINVQVVNEGDAAAWSDGETIWINASRINDIDLETLTNVTGLNYHELSHHFYSPRRSTTLVKYVMDTGFYMAYNLLEDARCETLLIARYPSVIPYLQEVTLRHIADKPESALVNYPSVYGKRYLPVKVREAMRDIFYKPEIIPDIQRIVDQYRLLAFPRDYDKAKKLIEEFQTLVLDQMDQQTMDNGHSSCLDRMPMVKGRPEPGKAQERDAKVAAGMGTRESTWTYKGTQPVVEKPEPPVGCFPQPGDPSDGNEEGGMPSPYSSPSGEATNTNNNQPTNQQEALDLRNENKAKAKQEEELDIFKPKVGEGHHKSVGGLPKDILDNIKDELTQIYDRKEVRRDIRRKQRVIITGREDVDEAESGEFSLAPVPAVNLLDYKKFANELQKLRDDSEPHWLRGVSSGKLNVRRFIRHRNVEEAFDRWTEGDDSTDIEAVILVDRSGSMNADNNDRTASLACWTIKRALEHIECPVTVYAFDDETEIAYTKANKAERTQYKFIYGSGGTDPYEALILAEKSLLSSQRKNKMMFIITDGIFHSHRNDDVIARIAKRGILTTMVLIMRDKEYADISTRKEYNLDHGAEIFRRVNSGKDLLSLAKDVVVGAIKKKQRT